MTSPWTRRAFLTSAAVSAAAATRSLAIGPPDTGLFDSGGAGDTAAGVDTAHTGLDTGVLTGDTGAPGPNIVVIFPDQWNGAHVGALGHPMVITPTLDSLLATSVNFSRCQTVSPLCQPARVSFVSRLFPGESGVDSNRSGPIDSTMASHVRRMRDEAGYRTAVIGKVHLHNRQGHASDHVGVLEEWGFEESVEVPGAAVTSNGKESLYTDFLRDSSPGPDFRQAYLDYLDDYMANHHRDAEWDTVPVDTGAGLRERYTPDGFIGGTAADWIRAQPGDRPFYLQVNFTGPHPPWNAPTTTQGLYDPDDPALVLPNLQDPGLPHSDLITLLQSEYTFPPTEAELRQIMVMYYANITLVDRAMLEVQRALRDSGHLEDTWIIFASDHGEMMGEKNLLTKLVFFDQAMHVPLAIRPPGGVTPWESAGWCDHFDLASTILEIGGLDPSDGRGLSLMSKVLDGPTGASAQVHQTQLCAQVYGHSMVRNDQYKLVVQDETGDHVEFYDLDADPEELVNQVEDPLTQAIRDDLQVQLDECLA